MLQWNAQSLRPKAGDLRNIVDKYDVLLITETWFKPKSQFNFPGFTFHRLDREEEKEGGVAIGIRDTIPFTRIEYPPDSTPNLAICGITVPTPKGEFDIYCLYKRPQIFVSEQEWNVLFNHRHNGYAKIIGGDFNCHSEIWGSGSNCRVGDTLLLALADSYLTPLNDGSITKVTRPNKRRSAVDITLASTNIALQCQWQVLKDTMGSDHYPISITTDTPTEKIEFFSHKLKKHKIDWPAFDAYLIKNEKKIKNFPEELNAPRRYEIVIETIMEAITSASTEPNKHKDGVKAPLNSRNCPPGKSKRRTPPAPWWNDECSKAVALRRKFTSAWRRNPSWSNYLAMKKQTALTKLALRKEKIKGWSSFCASLDRFTPINVIW